MTSVWRLEGAEMTRREAFREHDGLDLNQDPWTMERLDGRFFSVQIALGLLLRLFSSGFKEVAASNDIKIS